MSLYILLAHSGASLTADPRSFASLDDLRSWITRKLAVDAAHQILMTARGKQVKLQTLLAEQEIFLYDRRILSSSSASKATNLLPRADPPTAFTPETVPDSSTSDNTLQGLQNLCKRRRAWAINVTNGSRSVAEGVQKLDREISITRRGAAIAVENIKQHVGNLHPKYQESKTWADQLRGDHAFLLDNWESMLDRLATIRAYEELGKCLHGVQSALLKKSSAANQEELTLRDFVDDDEVRKGAKAGEDIARRFASRVDELSDTFERAVTDSSNIIEDFQQSMALSDSDAGDQAGRLMEEIEVLARKINADYEHVLGLPDNQKSISSASKTAQLHKTNFLPSLEQTNKELNQLLAQAIKGKERMMRTSVRYLQEIATIESTVSSVHSKLANLDADTGNGQAFDLLSFVIRLPSVYGSLLVECVRRQEWSDKMTADSSSLVEEIATYKEEESKRRKKWDKDMDGTIDLESLDGMALGIEVSVQAQKQNWPKASRDDVIEYIQRLRELGGMYEALKELEELMKTLDAPSKQQARRAKAFKNGSVHEAAYGRTSLLLRGDDEAMLALRNEKSKVEEKLKSAESRVRKLEDLLHRQSQMGQFSRPSSAAGLPAMTAPTFERYATTPVTNFSSALSKARETPSLRSSTSSRRISTNIEPEEKGLAQRVASLEAELTAEKAQSARLEKNAAVRSTAEDLLKSQVREATSTKEDLLGNLEAQQREFDEYRRQLEDENGNLKIQLETLEDEFDRVVESRENVDRVNALEEELERLRRNTASEVQKAHGQTELIRNDYAFQREKVNRLEQENQQQTEVNTQLSLRLAKLDNMKGDQYRALRSALSSLSREDKAPDDFSALVCMIESVAEKSAARLRDIQDALEAARADNVSLETRFKSQSDEIYDLSELLAREERQAFTLREELEANHAQCATLQSQLDFERGTNNELKTNFALGATDAEVLRSKLKEGERTIADLLSKIKEYETNREILESRLEEKEAILGGLQSNHDALSAVRGVQASQAVDISMKLQLQNAALERLLEQVGLTITKQDDGMVIQKAQRTTSASTTLNDTSTLMKRSLSGPLPSKSELMPSIDPELLRWADADDLGTAEQRFGDFMKEVNKFDLDIFTEAVYKRVKEIEHIARKWQKEARAYREKSHRAQGEAHDRIALRNFKEGDLALFLPTRDQATKPWAAFNVGAPHCFLREQDSHNLSKRDWLIARISKVEERVVDLSKSINGLESSGDQISIGGKSESGTFSNDENPYELSDGLRWYLIDAAEEKPGAPINVGLGKATVLSSNVDAQGSIRMKKSSDGKGATKTLTRSLDSRRSSTNSKKSNPAAVGPSALDGMLEQSIDNAAAAAASSKIQATRDLDTERPQSSQKSDFPSPSGQSTDHVRNAAASPSKSLRATRTSPQKTTSTEKPKAWDSLWALNFNLEGAKGKKGQT
ncbi:hypothetical protein N7G274_001805 [Stereocaulon virgatum]|uniref:Autophagy-related protein 11 n=1 Tax=Stereocaulon virgatum TaxID=373712 RepID=A0ABR4ASB4_9LECA